MTAVLAVAAFVLGGSCGGDGAGGKFSTGIDGTKPLGGLSADDKTKLCKAADDWARNEIAEAKVKSLSCKVAGIVAGAFAGGGNETMLRAACKTAYDQCLMSSSAAMASPTMCRPPGPACTATVAEYEACVNELPMGFDQLVAAVPSCETLTQASIAQLATLTTNLPPACRTAQMKCPQIFGGM